MSPRRHWANVLSIDQDRRRAWIMLPLSVLKRFNTNNLYTSPDIFLSQHGSKPCKSFVVGRAVFGIEKANSHLSNINNLGQPIGIAYADMARSGRVSGVAGFEGTLTEETLTSRHH
ncbi:MAG TPA: hypothetical protein VLV18_04240 [Terriglobales bacterium]|nr:hypothetical protein [Terriglobales bacterium]